MSPSTRPIQSPHRPCSRPSGVIGGIEAGNYIRDVSFQEDKVKTKHGNQAQVLASFRTLAIQLFRQAGFVNFKEALETFADCPDLFETFLIQYGFL